MKKIRPAIMACICLAAMASCGNNQNKINTSMETKDQGTGIFPLGERGPGEWFTGEVYVHTLLDPGQMENLYSVGQVTFTPGARTNWHTHPIGQTLLVLEGRGWYQERDKPAIELTKGSVVAIPKDVEHWHGASDGEKLVHIAISNVWEGSAVTWLTPVTDAEYAETNK